MILELLRNPLLFLVWAAVLVIALSFHEFAHALVSDRLGDPTARLNGRLTLNPLAHLDPLGTLMLLLVFMGWGKPVPVDPFNLRHPRRDSAIISLAGPAANLLLVLVVGLAIKIFNFQLTTNPYVYLSLGLFLRLNLGLAIFNLIPLNPLDGSKILVGFLPVDLAVKVESILKDYSLILLIILIFPFFGNSPILTVIGGLINHILALILPVGQLV